ncbi:MAG: hypothetical protein ACKVLM_20685, partial [Pseudomonadales bacterium]
HRRVENGGAFSTRFVQATSLDGAAMSYWVFAVIRAAVKTDNGVSGREKGRINKSVPFSLSIENLKSVEPRSIINIHIDMILGVKN